MRHYFAYDTQNYDQIYQMVFFPKNQVTKQQMGTLKDQDVIEKILIFEKNDITGGTSTLYLRIITKKPHLMTSIS